MLGICLPETNVSGLPTHQFFKPIGLLPGETLKICNTDTGNLYFIKSGTGLRHLPEPVYRVGEGYYVKETYQIIDIPKYKINLTLYKSDNKPREIFSIEFGSIDISNVPWNNKATMPQTAARSFIRITKCEVVCEVDEPFGYRYKYEDIYEW